MKNGAVAGETVLRRIGLEGALDLELALMIGQARRSWRRSRADAGTSRNSSSTDWAPMTLSISRRSASVRGR